MGPKKSLNVIGRTRYNATWTRRVGMTGGHVRLFACDVVSEAGLRR